MKVFIENHYVKLVVSSILGGFLFAICAFELVVAKSLNLFFVGGFIQSFGLLGVLALGLKVYNTELCSIFTSKHKWKTALDLLIMLVVNVLTIFAIGVLLRVFTNDKKDLVESCKAIAEARLITVGDIQGKDWYDALIASLLCGMIVATGVNIYKRVDNVFAKILAVVFAVGVYVVCGFEQIMTNTFYITFADMFSTSTIIDMIIVIIGNSIGSILVYLAMCVLFPAKPVKAKKEIK